MLNQSNRRTQLTLFLDPKDSIQIEEIRSKFNPLQYEIIKSHITLCREDELIDLKIVENNIDQIYSSSLTIHFGNPIRFNDGKGVLIPAIAPYELFQELRKLILKGLVENPRNSEPHITLMHPRNSICTDETFEEIKKFTFPSQLRFTKISLIEQELGKKWEIIKEFDF